MLRERLGNNVLRERLGEKFAERGRLGKTLLRQRLGENCDEWEIEGTLC